MIYPSYVTCPNSVGESRDIIKLLKERAYVNISKNFLFEQYLGIDGYYQKFVSFNTVKPDTHVLTPDQFVEAYLNFHQDVIEWIDSLQIGDEVIVEKRRACSYPCGFLPQMDKFSGQIMAITKVFSTSAESPATYRLGSTRRFYLENGEGYLWHGSMFELGEIKPIKTISLSEINLANFF